MDEHEDDYVYDEAAEAAHLDEIFAAMREEFAPTVIQPDNRTWAEPDKPRSTWHLLHRVDQARVRRFRQDQAMDRAARAAIAAGCSWAETARAAGMTPQGLRKRLGKQ